MTVTAQTLANAQLRLAQQIERIDKVKQANTDAANLIDVVRTTANTVRDALTQIQATIAQHSTALDQGRSALLAVQADIVKIKAALNLPAGAGK